MFGRSTLQCKLGADSNTRETLTKEIENILSDPLCQDPPLGLKKTTKSPEYGIKLA